MVSNVFYLNSEKYPAIANDCQQVKDHIDRQSGKPKPIPLQNQFMCIFEALPPVRRALCIPNKIQNGEFTTALGMAGLVLINFQEDLRDIKGAVDQLDGLPPIYDYKNYQHNFSFFRGTAIEKWLHKYVDKDSKWANWLFDNDKTLAGTSSGTKFINLLGAHVDDIIDTSITNYKNEKAIAVKYKGSLFGELTGRMMRRTTLLGIGALTLIEVPQIIHSISKKNVVKQTAKSAINIASVTAGIGYGGAIGAKYGGSVGSLIGMGAGAILGNQLATRAQASL